MTDLPETVTVEEQAKAAGQGKILPIGAYPDLDRFRETVQAFLRSEQPQHGEALAMAKTKATEMDFWLRTHRGRQQ
jgi:hypothetical protein